MVLKRLVATRWMIDLGVEVDWKIAPLLDQVALEVQRVRDVAVVRHREAAAGEVGEQRLDVAQAGAAGGRVAHVADRRWCPGSSASDSAGRSCPRHGRARAG